MDDNPRVEANREEEMNPECRCMSSAAHLTGVAWTGTAGHAPTGPEKRPAPGPVKRDKRRAASASDFGAIGDGMTTTPRRFRRSDACIPPSDMGGFSVSDGRVHPSGPVSLRTLTFKNYAAGHGGMTYAAPA